MTIQMASANKKLKLDGNGRQHRREVRRAVEHIDLMYSNDGSVNCILGEERVQNSSLDNLQCEGASPNPHDEMWMIDEAVTNTYFYQNTDDSSEKGDVLMHEDCVNSLPNETVVFDDSEKESELSFQQLLTSWSVGVPAHKLGDLLGILRNHKCFSYLPKDPRTLRKTPRVIKVVRFSSGSYYHFGVKEPLLNLLRSVNSPVSTVQLLVNVDGFPLSDSSNSECWPILAVVRNVRELAQRPLRIGLYHGKVKPSNSNEFLSRFIDEMQILMESELPVDSSVLYVNKCSFVGDLPAMALIMNVKEHGAFECCRKCTIRGRRAWTSSELQKIKDNPLDENGRIVLKRNDPPGRIVYIDSEVQKRTDKSFRSYENSGFHKGHCDLTRLPIDMEADFPIDPMHCLYIGTVKKLLGTISKDAAYKLAPRSLRSLNSFMESLAVETPREFSRHSRSLESLANWKATELRTFLHYTGPVALLGKLSHDRYQHFLTLHVAAKILSSGDLCLQFNDYAKSLLTNFVSNARILYGDAFISLNIHCLLHLADDVAEFGPMQTFWAFFFENDLGVIGRMFKNGAFPLQQIVKRIYEAETNLIKKNWIAINFLYEKNTAQSKKSYIV
jgi:hypothetical protein